MPDRSAAFTCRPAAAAALLGMVAAAASAQIVKPSDGAWIPQDEIEVIVKAAAGKLILNGEPLSADEPFPGVFHARIAVSAGDHVLQLQGDEGLEQVRFRTGRSNSRESSPPYVDHPPVRTECTHCHTVSRRGRFRFSGGCQACHAEQQFIQTHSHQPHELRSCGMCHDAHGSSVANLLALPKEQACKQCHN